MGKDTDEKPFSVDERVKWVNPYSAGIDFSRQNLTSKVDSAL